MTGIQSGKGNTPSSTDSNSKKSKKRSPEKQVTEKQIAKNVKSDDHDLGSDLEVSYDIPNNTISDLKKHFDNQFSLLRAECKAQADAFQKAIQNKDNLIEKLLKEIGELKATVSVLTEETTVLNGKIQANELQINSNAKSHNELLNKATDLEDRSRRNNVIFYNIPEHTTENNDKEDCEKVVVKLLKDKQFFRADYHIYIDRAHRLGHFDANRPRPRPIIVRFSFFKDKQSVISNGRLLKNSNENISEDYSKITLEEHKQLRNHGKMAKEKMFVQENENTAIVYYKVTYKRLVLTYTTNRHNQDAQKFTKSFSLNYINGNRHWYLPAKRNSTDRSTYSRARM